MRPRCGRLEGRIPLAGRLSRVDVERFVCGTLGCGCPDEVFQSISSSRLPADASRPSIVQLLVGSRLLIYVVAPPASEPADGWIEQVVAHGRAARDRHGYNRFRLVVASPKPPPSAGALKQRFARIVTGDDKAHLHFVATDDLPAGLEPRAKSAQSRPDSARSVAK